MAYDEVAFGRRGGQGDDARDRLGVHLGWEVVLLLGAAALGFLLYRLDPASLRRPALDDLLITGTAIGLLTLGVGVTLRAGVPNLAVGPIALAASLHFAENGDLGLVKAAVPALAIAAVGGLVAGLLIVTLHVPGWVVTLGAGMGVIVYDQLRTAPVAVQGRYDPSNQAFFLFGGFALLAVLGGAVGALEPVRRRLGAMRAATDPALRRKGTALPVIGSLVASSVFAIVAGILLAAQSSRPIVPGTGLEWTGIALGTALVAGTSAYGRRGGIFGTLLAVVAMTLYLDYADRRAFHIALFATAACAVGGGLVITRLVETYGRSRTVPDAEPDWQPDPPAESTTSPTWRPDLPETWSTGVGAQRRGDQWDDGPWGGGR
ncbi:ABC transporter permease [Krasilnikovia sp. MM14-A1259]|uniref:ABC transporter permease n=1 Tax=Krasilnikovia sp. MM14-A1259 TaxID=3373539 RepID=UPI00380DD6A2